MLLIVLLVQLVFSSGDPDSKQNISSLVTKKLKSGEIVGQVRDVIDSKKTEIYMGIPYAKPPIGDLRFEKPEAVSPWAGSKDATVLPPMCMQPVISLNYTQEHRDKYVNMSEDCLFVNVFVPVNTASNRPQDNLPVYVYFHGGSNEAGAALMLDGSVFAAKSQVVFVLASYRLGPLGFVGIPDSEMVGDYGIYDQIFALKWVQDNIHAFGGDKNQVTLGGHSAGAWDTGVLLMSPLATGLFHRVILVSGSPLFPGAYSPRRSLKEIQTFAELTGCGDHRNISGIKRCLQKQDAKALTEVNYKFMRTTFSYKEESNYWRLYHNTMYPSDILPQSPEILVKDARNINADEILMGVTSDEAVAWSDFVEEQSSSSWENLTNYVAVELGYLPSHPICNSPLVSEIIKQEYKNWKKPNDSKERQQAFIDVSSDIAMDIPQIDLAEKLSKLGKKIFLYQFDHVSKLNSRSPPSRGMVHGEDIFYMFGVPLVGHFLYKYDSTDQSISNLVIQIWSNFIKHGDAFKNMKNLPNKTNYDQLNQIYFRIHSENDCAHVSFDKHFKNKKLNFWNKLIPKLIQNNADKEEQLLFIKYIMATLNVITGLYEKAFGKT